MEWVVTTAKTIDEAKERALDQLGVAADEAEFEIVEEPKPGLFGRLKGEARVRARVRPTQVRPKQDRRDRRRGGGRQRSKQGGRDHRGQERSESGEDGSTRGSRRGSGGSESTASGDSSHDSSASDDEGQNDGGRQRPKRQRAQKEKSAMSDESTDEASVSPEAVGEAAAAFMSGLAEAFGAEVVTDVTVDGDEIDVRVSGSELGLLVGPGGRTLTAVQDLVRVASQRRLGDHDTRLRVDVGGYREKRREALEKFAVAVANQVSESGRAKALEPMSSADRKVVHDAIADLDGISSRSEGDEPNRRVVISPT